MDLSIIIASYNTKELTLAAVGSVLDSAPKLDYEIIVVDDGSSDGTAEALRELKINNLKLKILVNKTNLGYVRTNNRGIEAAKGKYVLLLNSDTQVKKGALEALVKFAESYPDAGVIGAKLLNADGSLQPSCFHLPTLKNAFLEYWLGCKGAFGKYAPSGTEPSEVETVVGAAFLITPQARKKIGGLNPAYKSYFEDLDYCRAVKKAGLKVYYLPRAEIVHYHGASFAKLADEKDRWRKLIPSSKIYHGLIKHYLINSVLWLGQKWQKFVWLLPMILAIPACLALFHKGFFPTQDYIYVARIQQMFAALANLQFPVRWASGFRYGEPLYNYYPPLVYYLGALIHLVGLSYLNTAKALYLLSFLLSSVTMYFLARKFLTKLPSLAIAALYVYAPYRSVDVYVRGAISEAWTFVFFPLIFLLTIRIWEKFSKRKLGLLALTLAGLFLTHNILTMLFLPFYLSFVLALFLIRRSWQFIKRVWIALGLGLGVAATYVLPALAEKNFVQNQNLTAGYFNYLGHFVAIKQWFITFWGYGASVWGNEDGMSFQVGLVHWATLVVAVLAFGIYFKKIKDKLVKTLFLSSFFLFGLSLFFQHNKSTFIWQLIPLLSYVQFPWRFLALSVFFASLAAIIVFTVVKRRGSLILAGVVLVATLGAYVGYFHPESYYLDSIDSHYVSPAVLAIDDKLPKDYLPVGVKVIQSEKVTVPKALTGEAMVTRYFLKGIRGSFEVTSKKGATVEVPVTFFPGWQVRVNNQKVKVGPGDNLGLLAFAIPSGTSSVKFWFGDTPVRTLANLISLASLAVVFLLLKKSHAA